MGDQRHNRVLILQLIDNSVTVEHVRLALRVREVLGRLSKQTADLLDLFQRWQHPFVVLQLLYKAVDPVDFLGIPVLLKTVNYEFKTLSRNSTTDLRAAVVENFYVRSQRLVHDVCGHVLTVSQIPQES